MTPAAAKAAYARQFLAHGETVVLRRLFGPNAGDYVVAARIMNFEPSDLDGSIQQGRRKAIILADEVAASGFPLPILPKQDRLVWAGKTLVITSIDDATRRIAGVAMAYELEIAGA